VGDLLVIIYCWHKIIYFYNYGREPIQLKTNNVILVQIFYIKQEDSCESQSKLESIKIQQGGQFSNDVYSHYIGYVKLESSDILI